MTAASSYGATGVRPRSRASSDARAARSSDDGPTRTISAPSARTRSSLIRGASDGITTTAWTPSRRAARATPWPWLPDEWLTTPAARAASDRLAMAL